MADVAISCLAARYCKMLINIEYLRCSMSIGLYKFELRCWRFPRQGFALPRNDILDGAVQQHDKHQFIFSLHLPHGYGGGDGRVEGFAPGIHGNDQLRVGIVQNFFPDSPALAADDHGHFFQLRFPDIPGPVG